MSVLKRHSPLHLSLLLCAATAVLAACDGAPPSKLSYPDMDSPEFQVFAKNCSYCHAPPLPTVHRAEEWPMVIARMNNHRIQRAYGTMNAGDKTMILRYLASHAAKEQKHEPETVK